MSDHRYRNKHRSLWPPRRVNTRLSTSQGAYYDDSRSHHYSDNPSVVASSAAMDIPPDTVIVHVPGVTSATRSTPVSEAHNGKCVMLWLKKKCCNWLTLKFVLVKNFKRFLYCTCSVEQLHWSAVL